MQFGLRSHVQAYRLPHSEQKAACTRTAVSAMAGHDVRHLLVEYGQRRLREFEVGHQLSIGLVTTRFLADNDTGSKSFAVHKKAMDRQMKNLALLVFRQGHAFAVFGITND